MVFVMANVAATFQESLIERVTNNAARQRQGVGGFTKYNSRSTKFRSVTSCVRWTL
jgi:hypothetical protein